MLYNQEDPRRNKFKDASEGGWMCVDKAAWPQFGGFNFFQQNTGLMSLFSGEIE